MNHTFDIEEKTLAQLQTAMQSGEVSARQLTEIYLSRIEQLDGTLKSVIEVNPDAQSIAQKSDDERESGRVRSALHGVPVLLKDNIDTADQMKTTAGSLALLEAPTPQKDAFLVDKLRAAGAIILGKTNLSEWANFRSDSSSSGWSGRGGQTRNPYILDRSPCGSSSGSGAAVAANLCALAVGTETDGSIVCPSAVNGIVGIKPTLGLISRDGIIPIAHSQDTAGPMARTVADAVALLDVLVGADAQDAITVQFDTRGARSYAQFLRDDALDGARIGVARQYFGRNARVDALMNANLEVLKQRGAQLFDVEFPELDKFGEDEFQVLLYEFKHGLNQYLSKRGGEHDSLAKIIEFNLANADKEMPYFAQETLVKAQAKGDLNEREYRLALLRSKFLAGDKSIDAAMDKDDLNAIVAPSNAPVWMIDWVNGDCPTNYVSSSSLAAVAGTPNITVPAGFISELPIGISFFGRAFSEPKLIAIAYAWEQATQARRAPKFLASYQ